jgi:hypothetical protein
VRTTRWRRLGASAQAFTVTPVAITTFPQPSTEVVGQGLRGIQARAAGHSGGMVT